jgi:hypothetical protein
MIKIGKILFFIRGRLFGQQAGTDETNTSQTTEFKKISPAIFHFLSVNTIQKKREKSPAKGLFISLKVN